MFRSFLLIVALAVSTGLLAQNQPNASGQTAGNPPSVVVVPTGPSIYIVAGGIYGTGVYVTPQATLPSQNVGISLAGSAGISLQTPLQMGVGTGVPAVPLVGTPIYNTAPVAPFATPAYLGQTNSSEVERAVNDLGPSYYGGTVELTSPEPSLGEVSAHYRAAPHHNVRMYTNADAQHPTNSITFRGSTLTLPARQ